MENLSQISKGLREFLSQTSRREKILGTSFCFLLIVGFFLIGPWSQPDNFPVRVTIHVEKGSGLTQVATQLEDEGFVRSAFWFKVFAVLTGGQHSIVAGDYYFQNAQDVIDVATRITHGDYGLVLIRVTLPEGSNNADMAAIFESKFSLFDTQYFLKNAPEGYLFPDTYLFWPNISAQDIISRMKITFDMKVEPLLPDIAASHKSLADIITMASIVEEEAKTESDRKIISGILWKRLSIGMALQVDSATSTYQTKGLPPAPISNPGFQSIQAALYPTETPYLYYLSDLKGNIYYATDFEGHQLNREKYLGH